MNRRKEIEARLAQIKTELETRAAELTAEELAALEKEVGELQTERAAIDAAIEKRNTLLATIAAGEQVDGAEPTVLRAFDKDKDDKGEDKYGTMAYRKAFMEYVTRGVAIPAEYRENQNTKTTDVGAVVPTTILDKIVSKMESVGGIYALVTKTAYKGGVSIPKQTLKPVATWVAEGAGSDKQKYTGGNITFAYHKLRCAVSVSFETDTMSIAAFETLLVNNIVEAMVKALEKAIVAGTGTGQPTGIITSTEYAEIVEVAAQDYDSLVRAEAAVPEAYETTAKWCMSKKTFMGYVGMTDKQGQPIARVNYGVNGKPERYLLGREVVLTEHLPNFSTASANDKFAFIFDFANYDLNTNYAIGIKKYEDNDNDDQITKGIMLADGKVVDGNGLVILKKIEAA
jgi:HK97 family phage major capsid protein|nr:MAG TPA: major capsid protein [Caudoviricetes sp.]DAJ28214.1 MAG TPA: major capsid protein [Bacteriophage sp.]